MDGRAPDDLPPLHRLCAEVISAGLPPPRHDTEVLVLPHGGLGDRVTFQAIVREAVERRRPGQRVVVVTANHADEYDVRHYRPAPDEVWVLRSLEVLSNPFAEVVGCAQAQFGARGRLEIVYFGAARSDAPRVEGARWELPYQRLGALAQRGIHPRFEVRAPARQQVRRTLEAGGFDPGAHRLIGVHCRSRPSEAEKNPSAPAMAATLRLLKARPEVRVLVVGDEDVPAEVKAQADFLDLGNRAPDLQVSAAWLEACHAFIGGDSGPMHLAAAVGTRLAPVLSRARGRAWGPFLPEASVRCVWGEPTNGGRGVLEFRADEAAAAVSDLAFTAGGA